METISILIRTDTGTEEKKEVQASQFFNLYDLSFAIHRPYGGKKFWIVSETTTGLLITSDLTQGAVIVKATKQLQQAGKRKVRNAVKQALKAQKEGNHVGN